MMKKFRAYAPLINDQIMLISVDVKFIVDVKS